MSDRRETRRALVEEADAPKLWTRRQTRRAMDDEEADVPGWRLAGAVVTAGGPSVLRGAGGRGRGSQSYPHVAH